MEKLQGESKYLFVAVLAASIYFYDQINWVHFLLLFWMIDVFGYWPGWLYSKITKTEKIPPVFYLMYNAMHNLASVFVMIIIYVSISDTPYSILAMPLHIAADRGILGNYHKKPTYNFNQGGLQT